MGLDMQGRCWVFSNGGGLNLQPRGKGVRGLL